eukprot:2772492-Pyramimonas_sp.AAC.1
MAAGVLWSLVRASALSAPALTSTRHTSAWPFMAAMKSGVCPIAVSAWFTFAFASTSART